MIQNTLESIISIKTACKTALESINIQPSVDFEDIADKLDMYANSSHEVDIVLNQSDLTDDIRSILVNMISSTKSSLDTFDSYGEAKYKDSNIIVAPTKSCDNTLHSCFRNCASLLIVCDLDVANVTNFMLAFFGCMSLRRINTSIWMTNVACSIQSIFYNCIRLECAVDLSGIQIKDSMTSAFFCCKRLPSVTGLHGSATEMNNTFTQCELLTTIDITNLSTQNVTRYDGMLTDCNALTSIVGTLYQTNVSHPSNRVTISSSLVTCTFGGTCYYGFSCGANTALSVTSLISMINTLYDWATNSENKTLPTMSNATWVPNIVMKQELQDKLTASQLAVATSRGWLITTS